MNWTQWKIGLLIAGLTGLMNGLVGLGLEMTPKQITILLLVNFGKDMLLYLKTHEPKVGTWLISAGLGLGLIAGVSACQAPRLEPGGAYAPTNAVGQVVVNDLGLAVADATYKFTYEATLSVFEFERANRAALYAIEPGIKHELDRLRPQVQDIDRRWAVARKEYRAHPTPASLSTVKTILAELQRLLPVAQTQVTLATAKLGQPQN